MARGGDQNGNGLNTSAYGVNFLNQFTSRTTPGVVDFMGQANPSATLTINGSSSGIYRRGEYFRRLLTVSNSGGPIFTVITNVATFGSSQTITGGVYTARSSETTSHITYDADGNLTGDSLWSYVWDGENRLVEMVMKSGTGISGATRKRMLFDYDWQGRRIQKVVENHSGGAWTHEYTRRFVYDGWNLIAELDGSNNRVRTYVWGTDLSGSQQGAEGVGGLLMVTQFTPSVTHHFVAYDGNGNVAGLVNAADGKYSARYAYGPFGEPLRVSATGAMDKSNPLRFSIKYTDDESGLLYYGYRYYDPNTGRWPNRDPIGEKGGLNRFNFVNNRPTIRVDLFGLLTTEAEFDVVIDDILNPPPVERPSVDPLGFALCMRDYNYEWPGEDILVWIWRKRNNNSPTDHAYLHFKPCDSCETKGYGIGGRKSVPEEVFKPGSCTPCVRTENRLQYGAPIKGTDATDEQIWDCISQVPSSRKYKAAGKNRYNCLDWALEAANKCGLVCE